MTSTRCRKLQKRRIVLMLCGSKRKPSDDLHPFVREIIRRRKRKKKAL